VVTFVEMSRARGPVNTGYYVAVILLLAAIAIRINVRRQRVTAMSAVFEKMASDDALLPPVTCAEYVSSASTLSVTTVCTLTSPRL